MKNLLLNYLTYSFFFLFSFSILWIACDKEEVVNTEVSITDISFELDKITLKKGEKKSIIATISPEEATKDITKDLLSIANSDEYVVAVSINSFTNGKATVSMEAKKVGKATLTLSVKNIDKKDTIEVIVNTKGDGGNEDDDTSGGSDGDDTSGGSDDDGTSGGDDDGTSGGDDDGTSGGDDDGTSGGDDGVEVTKITLDEQELYILEEGKDTLNYTADPDDAKDITVTWTSSNETIVTVNEKGEITAIAMGEANIFATSKTSPSVVDTCKVTVIAKKTGIPVFFVQKEYTMKVGDQEAIPYGASVNPNTNSSVTQKWQSSNENVATVASNGIVKAEMAGETYIIVTLEQGTKGGVAICKLYVEEKEATTFSKSWFLDSINMVRSIAHKCGTESKPAVGKVTWNDKLEQAALEHAEFLVEFNVLPPTHEGRNGSSVGDRVHDQNYQFVFVGENLAHGATFNQKTVLEGWIKSTVHCKNVMGGSFTEIGLVTYKDYWVLVFAAQ